MKLLITAGGQGTKVWPMSRENKPKQFQTIVGDKTMFRYQVETLLQRFEPKDIFISTKAQYVDFVIKDAPEIDKRNIIIEPNYKKNRGPGEGLGILRLSMLHPDEPFMIVQVDDFRVPENRFLDMIEVADKLVRRDKKFLSGGQKAIEATMGVDYLKLGNKISTEGNMETYEVAEFVYRKDSYAETKELIENFYVSTHVNHNCWYPDLMLDAYKQYMPNWHEDLMKIRDCFGKSDEEQRIDEIYAGMQEGPTEEVTKYLFEQGYIILVPFKWIDIGTWGSIYDNFTKKGKNYLDGYIIDVETKDTLVKAKKGKIVATIGLENIVIVDTDDVLLVCRKDRSGDIKLVLDELKKRDLKKYL